jgi:hypothetical protein
MHRRAANSTDICCCIKRPLGPIPHAHFSGPISDEELFYFKVLGISELLDTRVARIDEKLERAV